MEYLYYLRFAPVITTGCNPVVSMCWWALCQKYLSSFPIPEGTGNYVMRKQCEINHRYYGDEHWTIS